MTFFKKNKFIVLVLLVVFVLRLPSLFEPYWYGDENIYLSIGVAIRKGYLLYRDVFDNKPPLIYLVGALANGRMFWFRFLLSVSIISSIYFFYKLSIYFFKKKALKIMVSTGLFSFFTTIRALEGNIANAENFILLPTILGLYLFFLKEKSNRLLFLIGCLFSIGFLFKVTAVFDFLSLLFFITFFADKKPKILSKDNLFLLIGYLLPIIFTGLFFLVKGCFREYFSATFMQMFGYLGSWKTGTHAFSFTNLVKSELGLKAFFTFSAVSVFWLKRNSIPKLLSFLSIWFLFSLFGATFSGRPYPHYLIQVILPFCLLTAYAAGLKPKKFFFIPGIAIGLLALSLVHYRFWRYSTFPYYRNFLSFAVSRKSKTQYFEFFNPKLPVIYQAAELVAANSSPDDKLFVWADEPALYLLAQRLPATPYLVAYHIKDLNLKTKAAKELQRSEPTIIIVDTNMDKFPQMETLIGNNYFKIQEIANWMVFRKSIFPLKK